MKSEVVAVFPISHEHVLRIFDQGKRIFAKYTNFARLSKNSKIVFYVSKEKRLIGEGTIERIEKADPKTAWAHYQQRIFLTESEYNRYISESPVDGKCRKWKHITIFTLKNLKKYTNAIDWTSNMAPSGCYLEKELYKRITAQ